MDLWTNGMSYYIYIYTYLSICMLYYTVHICMLLYIYIYPSVYIPVCSYEWEGKVEEEGETLMVGINQYIKINVHLLLVTLCCVLVIRMDL